MTSPSLADKSRQVLGGQRLPLLTCGVDRRSVRVSRLRIIAWPVDPGLLLHLQAERRVSISDLGRALNHESGLLGVSGVFSDMRHVAAAADSGHQRAVLAMRIFAHRARQAIGAHAVTLGGVDALVFTGGIGENSADIRRMTCEGLSCLGLELDVEANASARADTIVSSPASRGLILVVPAREDLMMARAAATSLRV